MVLLRPYERNHGLVFCSNTLHDGTDDLCHLLLESSMILLVRVNMAPLLDVRAKALFQCPGAVVECGNAVDNRRVRAVEQISIDTIVLEHQMHPDLVVETGNQVEYCGMSGQGGLTE